MAAYCDRIGDDQDSLLPVDGNLCRVCLLILCRPRQEAQGWNFPEILRPLFLVQLATEYNHLQCDGSGFRGEA